MTEMMTELWSIRDQSILNYVQILTKMINKSAQIVMKQDHN